MARTLLNAAKSASNVVSINQVGWAFANECSDWIDLIMEVEILRPICWCLGAHPSPFRYRPQPLDRYPLELPIPSPDPGLSPPSGVR